MGNNLQGKTVVVTGATSGIGLAVAVKMAMAGAFVIGVGRLSVRNDRARASILQAVPDAKVIYLLADLSSQTQVRRLAGEIKTALTKAGYNQLDVLVNNAGVYMIRKAMTEDGIETTFAVNHLAGFLLTYELQDWLVRAQGRVLTTSSYSHRTTLLCLGRVVDPWPHVGLAAAFLGNFLPKALIPSSPSPAGDAAAQAYKRFSGWCFVLGGLVLAAGLSGPAFAVDPGLVNTEIASKGGKGLEELVWHRRRLQGTTAEVPARTYLYLAGEPEIDVSKGYYFKDSAPLKPSRQSEKEGLARRLWNLSCRLAGVKW